MSNYQAQLDDLAVAIQKRNEITMANDQARDAWNAEMSEALTREKHLKQEVEMRKEQLRQKIRADYEEEGVKPTYAGVTVARGETVEILDTHENVVAFCVQYAPQLLQLKGEKALLDFISQNVIESKGKDGEVKRFMVAKSSLGEFAVPVPFKLAKRTDVRISEAAVVTNYDEFLYNLEQMKGEPRR